MIFNAEQLALQPQGSVLTWQVFDDGLIAGDYRIRFVSDEIWELSFGGRTLSHDRSLTAAYITAERHSREALRHRVMRRNRIALAAAMLGWMLVDLVVRTTGATWFLVFMLPIVWVGFSSAAGMLTALGGDITHRYRSRRR